MSLHPSHFEIVTYNDIFILLVDLDEGRSVTNDADRVIRILQSQIPGGIGKRLVIYRDTTGRFDRMQIDSDGDFLGFALCRESEQEYFAELIKSLNSDL